MPTARLAERLVACHHVGVRIAADPSTDPADYEFHHQVRVRFAETDAMGIVHHSRYLPMLEEARVAYLRHIGHPYQSIRDDGIEMAVLEVFLQYRLPLRFDEVVDVHVSLAEVERATFQMAYLLTVAGEVRATAVTAHGCITTDGRPTRLPAWFRELRSPTAARRSVTWLRCASAANASTVVVAPDSGGRDRADHRRRGRPAGRPTARAGPTRGRRWRGVRTRWCRGPAASVSGRFTFDGAEHQLPINFGTHAIHGVGFDAAWAVARPPARPRRRSSS